MPATGLGEALAGVAIVGGVVVTVTDAEPVMAPFFAKIVTLPGAPPAVYVPLASIAPVPLTLQVNTGWESIGLPNWSYAVAPNCRVEFSTTDAEAGMTAMLLKV